MESSDLRRRDSHESVYGNLFKDPDKVSTLTNTCQWTLGIKNEIG